MFPCHYRSKKGWTPLTSVAVSARGPEATQVAKLLVENGAEVNPPIPTNVERRDNGALVNSFNRTYVSSSCINLSVDFACPGMKIINCFKALRCITIGAAGLKEFVIVVVEISTKNSIQVRVQHRLRVWI